MIIVNIEGSLIGRVTQISRSSLVNDTVNLPNCFLQNPIIALQS